jgi:hypothetical protein
MRYLVAEDLRYEKIWLELQAMSWNNPEIKAHLAVVNGEWRQMLRDALEAPRRELGLELPLEALVSLVMTFNLGIMLERQGGVETGHRELLAWIERLVTV